MKKMKWYRMWRVISLAAFIFFHVYWYKLRKKSDKEWEKLWEEIARRFRKTLFDLEGLLIKIGQLLSTRADLLPQAFIKGIQDLVDHVPPSRWEEIKNALEQEWDSPLENKLKSIEPAAIASASIGEVYRGRLEDGTVVAIKVQRPNIGSIIHTDFQSLSLIIWFAHHFAPVPKGFIDFRVLYKEIRQVIERELNFHFEMETSQYFQKRFAHERGIKIPDVFPELCTSKVIVMEWVEGSRISDTAVMEHHGISPRETASTLLRIFLPQWLEAGRFHADPHSGNVLLREDGTIILLDYGMIGEISKKDAGHFQQLIEAIIVKNYSKAVDSLIELDFLLPSADRNEIERLLAEALALDVSNLKQMDVFALKKQMNDIVRSLPIQVPTRFVFLGRAFVTVEGIIRTLVPDEDLVALGKPVFMDWLKHHGPSKWKLLSEWIFALPLFQVIEAIPEWLQEPRKLREWKEIEQQRQFLFTLWENRKKTAMLFTAVGIAGILYSLYNKEATIMNPSWMLIAGSLIVYIWNAGRQRRWLGKLSKRK